MPLKKSYITVTDQFCGAGGSSQGVRRLSQKYNGGIEVKMALNHWKLAIETHSTNFPDTLHDCTDVSACDPRRYPSTDILITSPECTTHSPAGGNTHRALKNQMDLFNSGAIDPATERSRATMWDVCRFAEYHKYRAIIVENVVEAKTRWALFDIWLSAMHKLGYDHKCVYLNSMHCHPTPQSRDRMYVVFWQKGNKAPNLDINPTAYCPKCEKDTNSVQTWKNPYRKFGKFDKQYVYSCPNCTTIVEPYYYAALNIIDFTNKGTRIGDRKKPLSPKTLSRINYGVKKYGSQPIIINDQHSTGIDFRVRSISDRIPTVPTVPNLKVVTPPFILKLEHGVSEPTSAMEQMKTQTTTQGSGIIFLTESYGKGGTRKITDPLNTVTAGGIKTGIVSGEAWNGFIASYYSTGHTVKHLTDPTPTQATKDTSALISFQTPAVDDCYYRMLKPDEIKLSMAFANDYVILGNSKDQVKQCGNAVTPPAMEMLVERVIESLN